MDEPSDLRRGFLYWPQALIAQLATPRTLRPAVWGALVPSASACSDHWPHVRRLGIIVSGVGARIRELTVVKHDCSLCEMQSLRKRRGYRGQDATAAGCACRALTST